VNDEILAAGTEKVSTRTARFEDVPGILRLIDRAIEHGCCNHYDERQRRSVYLGYASSLFIEALGPFETLVCERDHRLVGAAQIDLRGCLLRALFVDAELQGQGIGRALLSVVESHARAAGCPQLGGAMSLNAVSFYRRAGFRVQVGPQKIHGAYAPVPVQWMVKTLS
jgi:GNAT superfamily N-acetyltransferase